MDADHQVRVGEIGLNMRQPPRRGDDLRRAGVDDEGRFIVCRLAPLAAECERGRQDVSVTGEMPAELQRASSRSPVEGLLEGQRHGRAVESAGAGGRALDGVLGPGEVARLVGSLELLHGGGSRLRQEQRRIAPGQRECPPRLSLKGVGLSGLGVPRDVDPPVLRGDVCRFPPQFLARPFAGLPAEEDLVAMAQIIPAATATVRLTKEYGGKQVQLVTLLPEFVQGLKRSDGEVLVAMQTSMHSGDASRDVAAAILATLELPEGQALRADGLPEPGPRLQDVLDTSEPPAVSVRETFDFWVDPQAAGENAQARQIVEEAIDRAKEEIAPTRPVPGVEHAYWCRLGAKEFVRWVRGEDEDEFFNAFARIYAARESDLEEGARFVGAFRANGLAIPVWELVPGTEAEELTKPLQAMGERLEAALADTSPLSPEVRRAKAGIISRQVNL